MTLASSMTWRRITSAKVKRIRFSSCFARATMTWDTSSRPKVPTPSCVEAAQRSISCGFLPGEVYRLARKQDLHLQDFFKTYMQMKKIGFKNKPPLIKFLQKFVTILRTLRRLALVFGHLSIELPHKARSNEARDGNSAETRQKLRRNSSLCLCSPCSKHIHAFSLCLACSKIMEIFGSKTTKINKNNQHNR